MKCISKYYLVLFVRLIHLIDLKLLSKWPRPLVPALSVLILDTHMPRDWLWATQLGENLYCAEWIISYKCIQFCPERRVCNRTVNGLRGRGHLSSASLTAGQWSAPQLRGQLLTSDKESDMLGSWYSAFESWLIKALLTTASLIFVFVCVTYLQKSRWSFSSW